MQAFVVQIEIAHESFTDIDLVLGGVLTQM